jgi:hypothetical protein
MVEVTFFITLDREFLLAFGAIDRAIVATPKRIGESLGVFFHSS